MNANNTPLTVEQALTFLLAQARPVGDTESVETASALGRVLAAPLRATVNVPPLDNSAMDGYAVCAADLDPAGETRLPLAQRIIAGGVGQPLARGTAARIFTGAAVPPGADAVAMQEDCAPEEGAVVIRPAAPVGENIRRTGEDIVIGATVLTEGTRLRPQEMGVAASIGLAALPVFRRLRVAVFFTGNEIVMPGQPLAEGQIYNSNRAALRGLLAGLGVDVIDLGIVPDGLEPTVAALRQAAAQADVIITSGGVSVGEEDYVKAAVAQQGALEMWKVNMKPGKPLAFGRIGGAFFLGLPGNPVSALVTFCLFVRPFLLRCQGAAAAALVTFPVAAAFDWPRAGKRREFLRAKLAQNTAELYPRQGSGVLTSAAWADGLGE
ncbi:MAG TPA: molybdopterin molybdenumtransferase MoeA, partial [Betaproteobacteria bacterium]|nr:molybdopterin molybdenumtransferase MoeA [Betaproteobacteria bacterium]